MCGSSQRSTTIVTYESGRKETVPTCLECGHMAFPGENYAYVINGIAHKWASPADLKGTIETILKENLPTEDVANLTVEVVEIV